MLWDLETISSTTALVCTFWVLSGNGVVKKSILFLIKRIMPENVWSENANWWSFLDNDIGHYLKNFSNWNHHGDWKIQLTKGENQNCGKNCTKTGFRNNCIEKIPVTAIKTTDWCEAFACTDLSTRKWVKCPHAMLSGSENQIKLHPTEDANFRPKTLNSDCDPKVFTHLIHIYDHQDSIA